MRYFKLKIFIYMAVMLLGLVTALPSLLPSQWLTTTPSWYQQHKVTLGLDLRGGSHLLLHIDDKKLVAETSLQFADSLSSALRENAISAAPAKVAADGLTVILRNSAQRDAAQQLAADLQKGQVPRQFKVSIVDNGLQIVMTKSYRTALLADAVERSVEVLKRRINETGVVEPLITSQGSRGILVQLPGVKDPSRIKALIGRTAKLSFHLVQESTSDKGAATLRLPASETGQFYTLNRQSLLSGSELSDAHLSFDPNTQEPVVNFRLNQHGAEIFADITKANIGRAFAVVLDGVVVTAPVIRSAISGGSGQISGNFTSREASDLALLLRAGSLPASLSIVEDRGQRSVLQQYLKTQVVNQRVKAGLNHWLRD